MKQLAVGVLLGSLLVGSLWLWDRTTGIFQTSASPNREENADDPYWNVMTTDPLYWSKNDGDNKWLKADMKDCHRWVAALSSKQLGKYLMWEDRVDQFRNCMERRKEYRFKEPQK